MKGPLYDFAEEEGVAAFKLKALKDQERFLNSDEGRHKVAFDPDYITYLKAAYGRSLRDCWFSDHRAIRGGLTGSSPT